MTEADTQQDELQKRVQTVAQNLKRVMIGTVGTTNADGSPHVSPVFLAHTVTPSAGLNFVWSSLPTALHSQNIERTGQVFIVIFDSVTARGGGLYVQAAAHAVLPNDPAFEDVYQAFTARKTQFGAPASPPSYYQDGTQTLYVAAAQSVWVNMSRKDENGAVVGDERMSITVQQIAEQLI